MGLIREWLDQRGAQRYSTGELYHRSMTITRLVPSDLPEAPFRASIKVDWQAVTGQMPEQVEMQEIYRRLAEQVAYMTQRFSVLRLDEARNELDIELVRVAGSIDRRVRHVQVVLEVDDAVRRFADDHVKIRRENALIRAKHRAMVEHMIYMRDHVLVDAQMARLWWLGDHPEKLPQLVQMGGVFEQAIRLIKEGIPPEAAATPPRQEGGAPSYSDHLAGLFEDLLSRLGPDHREILVSQLGQVFNSYERPDLVGKLRSDPATGPHLNGSAPHHP